MSTVGFIGLGNMGGHMARNLMRAGHSLVVFDANPKTVQQFKSEGATVASSPAEVGAAAKEVVTMLPSSPHVRDVYSGKKGLLETLKEGSLCLDSSTIDQSASIEVAKAVADRKSIYLDAPVSGGVLGAQNATLTFMVGGAGGKPELLTRAKVLLDKMGKNVVCCGSVGSGQAAKICNNMLLAIEMIGTAETMNLGLKMGLDPKKLASIINTSSGRCWSSDTYNPCPGVIEGIPPSKGYEGGFGSALMAKDLSLAQNAATTLGAPTPLGSLSHQIYRLLAQHPDFQSKDFGVVFKFLAEGKMMTSVVGRPLHYVIKIGDRKKSYEFYVGTLGMKILRHEEFSEGCKAECNGPFNGQWSKTMVGYGEEDDNFVVEMTYNYEIGGYTKGDELHGLYVDNKEVFDRLTGSGASCWDEDRRLRLRDPDGNSIFVGGEATPGNPTISKLALNVKEIDKSVAFWSGLLGMKVESKEERVAVLSYGGKTSRPWVLQLNSMGKAVNRASAYGRTAFACVTDKLAPLELAVKSAGGTVLKPLVSLDTPGKATVHVVILADPDGHEICFVGEEAFKELSRMDPSSDGAMQKAMKDDWSGEWFKKGKKTI